MGGSSTQPQQTSTTQISPQAQQLFNLAYPTIASYAANPPTERYPGSTVAGFTPEQMQAQQMLLNASRNQQDVANQSRGALTDVLGRSGGYTPPPVAAWQSPGSAFQRTPLETSSNIFSDPGIWNAAQNPGLSQAITAAQRPTWQALTEQALPAVRQSAIAGGPFGGSRQGLAEGLAIGRGTQTAGDIAAKMAEDVYGQNLAAVNQRYATNLNALNQRYGTDVGAETAFRGQDITGSLGARGQDITARGQDIGAYQTGTEQMLRALGLSPTVQGMQTVPGQTVGMVGDVGQQMSQAQLNDAINAYYYQRLAPYLQSRDVLSLLQSFPGATTISTGNTPQANPIMQSLGTGLQGATIGNMIFPGGGAAIGGLGGATLPFLFR